jgi:hypothetical protein
MVGLLDELTGLSSERDLMTSETLKLILMHHEKFKFKVKRDG